MEAKKVAKLNMFHAVISLCEDNLPVVALVAAFQTSYHAFKAKAAAIMPAMEQLEAQTGGYRVSKKTAKKALAKMGSEIAGMVYAYASTIDDEVMQEAMHISSSDIINALDDEVALICGNIYSAANTNVAVLGDFGVTPGLLVTFSTTINDYINKVPKPRASQGEKKALRQQMYGLFDDADGILKQQMDKVAVNFGGNGNGLFLRKYRAARVIVDPGSFSTVLKILVVNGATNQPLRNVKCYRDASVVFKLSRDKGRVTFKNVEEGNHEFKLKHKLFADAVASVMMSHGEKKVVTVVMQPIV